MSVDRLEAWELKLAARAVADAMDCWADAMGARSDLLTLWRGTPALACEAIAKVMDRRSRDICLVLAVSGGLQTAAFLSNVHTWWDDYRCDFINAVLEELEIKYEL